MHLMCLGLVGWISYWCCGDTAPAGVILVVLINTFGLTLLVSDALGNRKQKEAETNVMIVDLFKHTLDETKNVVRLPSDSPKSHVFFLSIGLVESVVTVVYIDSRKREIKIRLMNEGRCHERLKSRVDDSTCLIDRCVYWHSNI